MLSKKKGNEFVYFKILREIYDFLDFGADFPQPHGCIGEDFFFLYFLWQNFCKYNLKRHWNSCIFQIFLEYFSLTCVKYDHQMGQNLKIFKPGVICAPQAFWAFPCPVLRHHFFPLRRQPPLPRLKRPRPFAFCPFSCFS